MKQRRKALRVDTFPFLAVLLCAMGSLILILLVMDRRARLVAQARGAQAAAQVVALREEETRRRQEEWDRARQALRAQLQHQLDEVQSQAEELKGRLAAVQGEKQATELSLLELQALFSREQSELDKQKEKVQGMQADLAARLQLTETNRAQLTKLTADLLLMEKALADLKALRQRQQQTFSLVPYKGKHGENRRPIYVECYRRGVLFHPERLALEGFALTPLAIRKELDSRLARQRATLPPGQDPDKSAYILLLLRPSGIEHYYKFLNSLAGLKIDFGYELVDEEWVLDFSENGSGTPPSWQMTSNGAPGQPAAHQPPGSGGMGLGNEPGSNPGAGPARLGPPSAGGLAAGHGTGTPGGVGGHPGGAGPFLAQGRGTGTGTATPGGSGAEDGFGPPGDSSALAGSGSPGGTGRLLGQGRGTGTSAGMPGGSEAEQGFGAAASGTPNGGTGVGSGRTGASGGTEYRLGMAAGTGSGPDGLALGSAAGNGFGTPGSSQRAGQPAAEAGQTGQGTAGAALGAPLRQGQGPGAVASASGSPTIAGGAPLRQGQGPGAPGAGHASPGANSGLSPAPAQGSAGPAADNGPKIVAAAGPKAPDGTAPGAGRRAVPKDAKPVSQQPSANPEPADNASQDASEGEPGTGQQQGQAGTGGGEQGNGVGVGRPVGRLPFAEKAQPPERPVRPTRISSNRDWVIVVECKGAGAVLQATGQQFENAQLAAEPGRNNPLLLAVKQAIARRQAGVRPGEAEYIPQVRYLVDPDGLRAFHLAYPALEPLQLTTTRENREPKPE